MHHQCYENYVGWGCEAPGVYKVRVQEQGAPLLGNDKKKLRKSITFDVIWI